MRVINSWVVSIWQVVINDANLLGIWTVHIVYVYMVCVYTPEVSGPFTFPQTIESHSAGYNLCYKVPISQRKVLHLVAQSEVFQMGCSTQK